MGEHPHTHAHAHGTGHSTGVHGMLLFGDDVLYLSHLPMLAEPHHYQVVVEAAFDDEANKRLLADRAQHGDGMHTFEPEVFPMVELDPSGEGPRRSSIVGTIYRGHFERGGQPIARAAVASVRSVVHFDELDVDAVHDQERDLAYLCFGRAARLHLAHHITASPDFDQVLTARFVPGTVTDPAGRPVDEDATRDFEPAAPVRIRGRRDAPDERLRPGEIATGSFFTTVGPTGSHGFGVDIAIDRVIYLETEELGSP